MKPISDEEIKIDFNNPDIEVLSNTSVLKDFLRLKDLKDSVLLLMSSGTFGNLDLEDVKAFH